MATATVETPNRSMAMPASMEGTIAPTLLINAWVATTWERAEGLVLSRRTERAATFTIAEAKPAGI